MGLETATYINGLDINNPSGADNKSQGDDHIRLLKSTIKSTFPNVTGAITPSQTEFNYVTGVTSSIQAQFSTKGNVSGQIWTGTHVLPATTSIGNVDATEISYLDGVTSSIQSQFSAKANKAGDTHTGTHNFTGGVLQCATAVTANEAVNKAQLDAQAFSTVLPAQAGNAGKYISTDGTAASWQTPQIGITTITRTSNTMIVKSDNGKMFLITSGTFNQTFDACATLGSGWSCWINAVSSGTITADPNGSETIDGATTGILRGLYLITCDGSSLRAQRFGQQTTMQALTSGTSWVAPLGVYFVKMRMQGAGGGSGDPQNAGSAGGAGGYLEAAFPVSPNTSYTYGIGTFGTQPPLSSNSDGTDAGPTTFTANGVTYTANGGTRGIANSGGNSGSGGTATNGNINISGGDGRNIYALTTEGYIGGESMLGTTSYARGNNSSSYKKGKGYGFGGAPANGSPVSNGDGGPAIIILEY